MLELDISKQCQEEWDKTLNVDLYANPDDELIDLMDKIINHKSSNEDIKRTVIKLARIFNVRIDKVIFISDDKVSLVGGYDKTNNSIVFNFTNANTFEIQGVDLLATIVHELRHAQQNQRLRYIDSELGRTIADSITNYRCSTDSVKGLSIYYTNFIEIDAETFAHKYTRHLLDKLKEKRNISYAVDMDLQRRINDSQNSIQTSRALIHHNRKEIEAVYTSFEKYMKTILPSKELTKEQKNEIARKLIEKARPIIDGNGKENFGFYIGNLHYLQDLIYEDSDPFMILDNLDSDFIKYIEELENKFRDLGLTKNEKYTTHLKDIVTKCERLLMSKKIPFDKNNPSETVKMAFEILPKVILENMGKPKNESISQLENLLLSISVYMRKQSKSLIDYTKNLIEENIPSEQIAKYLEKNVEGDDKVSYCGPYEIYQRLLDGYASDYRMETYSHPREKLLKKLGIRYNKDNFYEIREKFSKVFPKFLLKCLLKKNLTDEEKSFVSSYEYGNFGDIDQSLLEKEIKGNIFIQSKLNRILKENNHPVLTAFEKRGVNLSKLIKTKQTK